MTVTRITINQRIIQMSAKLKIILSIVGSLVIVAGISLGTILLLNHFKSTVKEENTPAAALKTVAEPEKLIGQYRKASLASRTDNYSERKKAEAQADTDPKKIDQAPNTTLPTNTTVVYEAANKYETRITVQDNAQYERKDKKIESNDDTIKSDTETFLIDQGLVRTKDQITLKGLTYTTFDSANVLCQISDFDSSVYGVAIYGLACISKTLITQEYKKIDDLLALYKPSDAPGAPTKVYANALIQEDNKKLQTLTVAYNDKDSTTLIFAAIDDTWEYIGERAIPNPDVASSFVMSADLKSAISGAKWGTFLQKNIR